MSQILLRAEEAARALGIGRSKLYALVAAGELPVIRIGRATRIPAAALERWVEERIIACSASGSVPDRSPWDAAKGSQRRRAPATHQGYSGAQDSDAAV